MFLVLSLLMLTITPPSFSQSPARPISSHCRTSWWDVVENREQWWRKGLSQRYRRQHGHTVRSFPWPLWVVTKLMPNTALAFLSLTASQWTISITLWTYNETHTQNDEEKSLFSHPEMHYSFKVALVLDCFTCNRRWIVSFILLVALWVPN